MISHIESNFTADCDLCCCCLVSYRITHTVRRAHAHWHTHTLA